MNIVKDGSLNRPIGIADVKYPDRSEWDIEAFEDLKSSELSKIRAEGANYDREVRFRNDPYFRYFRKFKKTYPVMMQIESFLLKDRPFPRGEYINSVAFLTELKTGKLLGTHDVDRVIGDIVFYEESVKTPFTGMINPDCHSYPGDATGRDDEGIIISMIAGADDRTCIHSDTSHVIYIMFGHPESTRAEIEDTAKCVMDYVNVLAPGAEVSSCIY